jgi:peptidoglycan/xylan/chitin deacetylase (PgdA/CDA1 family)
MVEIEPGERGFLDQHDQAGLSWAKRMKIKLRNSLARVLLPVAHVGNWLQFKVPILLYHRVLPEFPLGSARSGNVPVENFEAQMKYLADSGYASLSVTEFEEILGGGRPTPERPVLITFDDGYADTRLIAFPLARKYGIKLNVFLPTKIIGADRWPDSWAKRPLLEERHLEKFPDLWRPLTWEEVAQMEEGGVIFESHGHSHRRLSSLSDQELDEEISESVATFKMHLGRRPRGFAIPWGDEGSYTFRLLDLLMSHGISAVFTTTPARLTPPVGQFLHSRTAIKEYDDLGSFVRKLQGAHRWLQYLGR